MSIPDDITLIGIQEKDLSFPFFDYDIAWKLGLTLRELAIARNHSIVIDVRRFGQPHQPLFYSALPGTTPDSARWVQRKSNVVARFHRSSYGLGLFLQHNNTTIPEKYALPDAEYAAHGGAFPIHVTGTGIIGSVAVSGLPQREDHNLVVEALCIQLNRDPRTLRLPTPQ
jgi:uncharacterized protein (UPF0303 family)